MIGTYCRNGSTRFITCFARLHDITPCRFILLHKVVYIYTQHLNLSWLIRANMTVLRLADQSLDLYGFQSHHEIMKYFCGGSITVVKKGLTFEIISDSEIIHNLPLAQ